MKPRTATIALITAATATVVVGGTVAYAQIPSANGTISACYTKSGGAVRIIDGDSGRCKSGETLLTWNQKGAPGTNGADGADGADGTDGVSGYEIVTTEDTSDALGLFGGLTATCPAGKHVTGGGASVLTDDGGVQGGYRVSQSSPNGDTGWIATFDVSNPLGTSFVMKVYAICATVQP